MPIYEYQCKSCQHELEVLQKMSADPLQKCPECGKEELKKKVSATAFRLKGGGWYETDFKTGDKKNLASASDSSDKKESSGGKAAAGAGKSDSSSGSGSSSSSGSGSSSSSSSGSSSSSSATSTPGS